MHAGIERPFGQLELTADHELDWLGEWADRLVRWEFRRGLLHSVTLTPEAFVTHGEALFLDHPVERVALVNDAGESLAAEDVSAPINTFVTYFRYCSGDHSRSRTRSSHIRSDVIVHSRSAAIEGSSPARRLPSVSKRETMTRQPSNLDLRRLCQARSAAASVRRTASIVRATAHTAGFPRACIDTNASIISMPVGQFIMR